MEIDKIIFEQAEKIAASPLLHYERLPDIDLYVEQMTSYLEERMGDSLRVNDEKIITKPMVNNYTKAGLLPRPNQKRYNRDHLISLAYICLLKQSLTFNDIKAAFDVAGSTEQLKFIYEEFAQMCEEYRETYVQMQQKRLERIKARLGPDATEAQIALLQVSLNSIEATADRLMCARILQEIKGEETND